MRAYVKHLELDELHGISMKQLPKARSRTKTKKHLSWTLQLDQFWFFWNFLVMDWQRISCLRSRTSQYFALTANVARQWTNKRLNDVYHQFTQEAVLERAKGHWPAHTSSEQQHRCCLYDYYRLNPLNFRLSPLRQSLETKVENESATQPCFVIDSQGKSWEEVTSHKSPSRNEKMESKPMCSDLE